MAIRVLIADDHAIVADGLRFVVDAQADMTVVASAQDGRDAVQQTIATLPDVVLIDHAMPQLNGTEATRLIRERVPRTRVIILSMHANQTHVLHALQAGALGYVVKRSAAKEVVEAIRTVHQGRRYLSKDLVDSVLDQVLSEPDAFERLSSRERQVLQLLAEGHTVADIAARLLLSVKTVETYRTRMMEKLDIRDFANLVKFAIQHGITDLELRQESRAPEGTAGADAGRSRNR